MITADEKRELLGSMKDKEHHSLERLVESLFGDSIDWVQVADTVDYDDAMEHLTEAMAMSMAIGNINAKLIIKEQ